MKRSWIQRVGYDFSAVFFLTLARIFFRTRIMGRELSRIEGGVLVCSNHQSFLDPIIIGMACRRRLSFLARESLFRNWILARVMWFYEAIPIQRDGMGIGGIKETLKRLKKDHAVLIFPEGTRTPDGSLLELKPGFCAVARRAKVPILPVAMSGAYEAWPRDRKLPGLSKIRICFGEPIQQTEIAEISDERLMALLRERMAQCLQRATSS